MAGQPELIEEARKLGYTYQERQGRFFLPIVVDAGALAEAMADEAIEQALEPFEAALKKLNKDQAFFDRVLTSVPID